MPLEGKATIHCHPREDLKQHMQHGKWEVDLDVRALFEGLQMTLDL